MSITYGFCHCGCGERTNIAPANQERFGHIKGEPFRYIRGHQWRGVTPQDRASGNRYRTVHGYIMVSQPTHPRASTNGYVYEHVLVAESVLGKHLPDGAVVHHINGIKTDNRKANLLICPDSAYHQNLHRRQRALEACGNPSYMLCEYCKEYDDPTRMWVNPRRPNQARHRSCHSASESLRYARRKSVP